jgi:putative glycosyltransferase (TIGR04348 family)
MAASGNPASSYESAFRPTTARLAIVTPAAPGSHRGNRVTAERWANLIRELGHAVEVLETFAGASVDGLIVLHAGRSAASIRRFRDQFPMRPLLVAVTGTDVYGDEFDPAEVARSFDAADRIIVLQPKTAEELPGPLQPKVRIVYQSAEPPPRRDAPRPGTFEVAVVGHLRPVKDPFRAAEASRLLDPASTIRILHLGEALSADMADRARQEAAANPRYEWLGDLSHEDTLALMARSRLVALTSLSEGGPAVISEAIVAGVPVVATRVSGCVGMLGDDYPGLFPIGDTQALARMLNRAERDVAFYQSLQLACDRRRSLFRPEAELSAWRDLLAELRLGDRPADR